eukprot:ctg_2276.g365
MKRPPSVAACMASGTRLLVSDLWTILHRPRPASRHAPCDGCSGLQALQHTSRLQQFATQFPCRSPSVTVLQPHRDRFLDHSRRPGVH